MARNARNVELPFPTYARMADAKRADARRLYDTLCETQRQVVDQAQQAFEAAGGCARCRGRGWVVTWDTLDSMSGCYAEYGACPNEACTAETRRASGLAPTYDKYDRNRGLDNPVEALPSWRATCLPLQQQVARLHDEAKALDARGRLVKGTKVVVVAGRKLPLASTWRVAYVSNDGRVLLKDEARWEDRQADGAWVDPANVEAVAA